MQAITVAGSQCCMKMIRAIANARTYAQQSGKGDAFSAAAADVVAQGGVGGCSGQAIARVRSSSSATSTGIQGSSQATLATKGIGGESAGTYSFSHVIKKPDGTFGLDTGAGVGDGP